jgi:flavodoxin
MGEMKSCVIYATTSGNTRRVAETIAEELRQFGEAELIAVEDAPDELPLADLVLIGGPTEGHGVSKPMARYLERLDQRTLAGRAFAAFDTRLRWPKLLSGSAAESISRRLADAGARAVTAEGSFIVSMKPELEPGELERARQYATKAAEAIQQKLPLPA